MMNMTSEKRNLNVTQLDTDQMIKRTLDESHDAQRVIIVSGAMPESIKIDVDTTQITDAIRAGIKFEQFEAKSTDIRIERIEVPVIVKEYEKIEVPIITKEIEYREIKVPYEVTKIIEIEKPIIIKETIFEKIETNKKELMYLRIACGLQFLAILIFLAFKK